jgi:hypothetical protein
LLHIFFIAFFKKFVILEFKNSFEFRRFICIWDNFLMKTIIKSVDAPLNVYQNTSNCLLLIIMLMFVIINNILFKCNQFIDFKSKNNTKSYGWEHTSENLWEKEKKAEYLFFHVEKFISSFFPQIPWRFSKVCFQPMH